MNHPPIHYQLREYQESAVQATLNHFRASRDPAVIVLPTGAGKSLVIAELARLARGKVLCLAHVKELVEQNYHKFRLTGQDAGIYSAGLKQKQLDQPVTFASIQSVSPNLHAFTEPVSLLVIDECHRVAAAVNHHSEEPKPNSNTNQYQAVIAHLRSLNPKISILGLTATPFRLGFGWIYQDHYHGFQRGSEHSFFKRCIYELPLRYMIKHGYLTPPKVEDATVANYNFDALESDRFGNIREQDLNHLISKYPRVTQAITEQIQELANSRHGCMIFAATVKHAEEIILYLPEGEAALITGDSHHKERDDLIQQFKQQQIKYLVNVSVLTTGFDAPHVDLIAILRPTKSVSLYQQIVGRGLRLSSGKEDCLILDYAGNNYDLHTPEIGNKKPSSDAEAVLVECPVCHFQNTFWGKKDEDGVLLEHYGRRCAALLDTEDGEIRCEYRFRFKNCPHCDAENDIAARVCQQCAKALVDPDDILKKALGLKDAKVIRCAGIRCEIRPSNSIKITYFDEDGSELHEFFDFKKSEQQVDFCANFVRRLAQGTTKISLRNTQELQPFIDYLPHPDFVIARKNKRYWQVTERLFDYQGSYRKANCLD